VTVGRTCLSLLSCFSELRSVTTHKVAVQLSSASADPAYAAQPRWWQALSQPCTDKAGSTTTVQQAVPRQQATSVLVTLCSPGAHTPQDTHHTMPKAAAGAGPYICGGPAHRPHASTAAFCTRVMAGITLAVIAGKGAGAATHTLYVSLQVKGALQVMPAAVGFCLAAWPPGTHTIQQGHVHPNEPVHTNTPLLQHSGQACTRCCKSANGVSVSQAPGQHANTSVGLCAAAQQQPTSHVKSLCADHLPATAQSTCVHLDPHSRPAHAMQRGHTASHMPWLVRAAAPTTQLNSTNML
jgi:hypothetical protein